MGFVSIFKLILIGLHVFLWISIAYHIIIKYNKICPVRAPYHIWVANLHWKYNDDFKIEYKGREYYSHWGHRDYTKSTVPLSKYLKYSYINYLFEQAPFDYRNKKYYYDTEVFYGFTRYEIGFAISFILLTFINYLIFIEDWLKIRQKHEYIPNRQTGLATLFDNPNNQKPIWDRPTKPNIKNIWTGPEILEKPNAVKINENSTSELSAEEIRLQRLKQFEQDKPKKTVTVRPQVAFSNKSDWN